MPTPKKLGAMITGLMHSGALCCPGTINGQSINKLLKTMIKLILTTKIISSEADPRHAAKGCTGLISCCELYSSWSIDILNQWSC